MALTNQQFTTLLNKFSLAANKFCNDEYNGRGNGSLISNIQDLELFYNGIGASTLIADADTYTGYTYTGAQLKNACANLFSMVTTYEAGVNTNLWKILTGQSDPA